jgi:adenylate cyclase class IV
MGYEDLDGIEEDEKFYLKLCKKYGENPEYHGPKGHRTLDLLGATAQRLKLREGRERRRKRGQTLEIEVKLPVDQETITRLEEILGPANWKLQENVVYQTPQGIIRFRKEGHGTRLEGYKTTITIKGKNSEGRYNQRSEIEQSIDDSLFEEVLCEAEKGGAIIYSKQRANYDFGNCTICLDNLDGKYFVEIEGTRKDITRNISKFGLKGIKTEKRSYDEIVGGRR